jgi:putative (di)nucleoside polyphosphate hydrolase
VPHPDKPAEQTFRAGVGAVIQRPDGAVLALLRSDDDTAWQFPQGGLKPAEEPRDALFREVREETGLESWHLRIQSGAPRLLAYELPEEYRSRRTGRGQVLYWYRLRFDGADELITLGNGREFSDWRWMKMADLVAIVSPFRRQVYVELGRELEASPGYAEPASVKPS